MQTHGTSSHIESHIEHWDNVQSPTLNDQVRSTRPGRREIGRREEPPRSRRQRHGCRCGASKMVHGPSTSLAVAASVSLLVMAEEKPKTVTANTRNRTEYSAPEASRASYGRVPTATRLVDPFRSVQLGDPFTISNSIVSPVPHPVSLRRARSPSPSPHAPRLLMCRLATCPRPPICQHHGRAAALRETCDHVGRRQCDREPNPGVGGALPRGAGPNPIPRRLRSPSPKPSINAELPSPTHPCGTVSDRLPAVPASVWRLDASRPVAV